MTNAHQIGQIIGFTTPEGDYKQGEIVGRDWSFSTLLAYTVCTQRHERYRVNAETFKSGHTF